MTTATMNIRKDIGSIAPGEIILLESSSENSLKLGLTSLQSLLQSGYKGIVLSASRPFVNLRELYEGEGIDVDSLFFIDCLSKHQGEGLGGRGRVVFVESPSSLNELALSLSKLLEKVKGKKFVFIDSITSLLIHNKADLFARFVHGLLTRMRLNDTAGVLIFLEDQKNRDIRAEIAQLCDRVIKA